MSKTEKWETVGKNKSKAKTSKPKDFGDFGLSKKFPNPLSDVSNTKTSSDELKTGQKSPGRNQQKKKVKKQVESLPKYDYKTIEDGLEGEAFQQFDEQILTWKKIYPDNPMNVCKDLVIYLDDRLRCPDESVIQTGREFDFPLCKATKGIQNKLMKVFSDLNIEMVECMFQHYINSMLELLNRDCPIWGHKLCIQALSFSHPQICSQDLDQFIDKVQTMQNVPKKCLSLLWALGQSGVKDSRFGMKVWLEVMLPALHMKNIAPYCMHYIESILARTHNKSTLNSSVQPQQFMEVASWTFDSQMKVSGKSSLVKDRMKDVYPTLKDIMTSNQNNKRQLFKTILSTPVKEGEQLRDELTSLAVGCLATDAHCFSLWRNLYSSNLPRTRLILQHLYNDWKLTLKKMPGTPFAETIRAFNNTNSDAAKNSEPLTSKQDFHQVRVLCEEMSERLTVSRDHSQSRNWGLWLTLGVAVVAVCVGLVYYDVTVGGGVWEKSRTFQFMESKGILSMTSHVWERLERSHNAATSFFQENVPIYWEYVKDVLGPYTNVLGEKISSSCSYLWEITESVRGSLYDVIGKISSILRTFALMTLQAIDYVIKCAIKMVLWTKESFSDSIRFLAALISGEMTWTEAYDDIIDQLTISLHRANLWSKNIVNVVSDFVAPEKP